jgi:hypothetical protein
MSEMAELLSGIALLCISLGVLMAVRPRKGKPIGWVRKPFVGPTLAIVLVAGIGMGTVFLANYFTTIDDMTFIRKQRY